MTVLNRVLLVGNLTRDPELRKTPKGTAVCQIGLALNESWKDAAGNTHEEVTFVDVDSFGRQAEVIAKHFRKGRLILVEGRMKLDTWEDRQTREKRSKLKVVLDSFQFMPDGLNGKERDS